MLAFLTSANVASKQPMFSVPGEERDKAPNADISPVQDVSVPSPLDSPAQATEEPETRVSFASVPTIDSAHTIQGPLVGSPPPGQAPVQSSPPNPAALLVPPSAADAQGSPSVHTQSSIQSDPPLHSQSQSALPYSPPDANSAGKDPRRFSFPSFSFLRSDTKRNKTRAAPSLQLQAPSTASQSSGKRPKANGALSALFGTSLSSEKRAKESAAIVRSVIIGNHNTSVDPRSSKTKSASKSDVARVKAQLLDPKTAAKVIAHLRTLPAHANGAATNTNGPIRAVCLDMPDRDVHEQHFVHMQSVALASVSTISTALENLHIVDLLTAPNMGFGAPVTAQGLFAGSVPTAETVIDGIEEITPQLMALGYATGKAILPDHRGVIVPTDRISVLTYWWGLEICIPPPTIAILEAAESPGSMLLNLLTAISVLNEGVREIVPFIRYIAQFVQTEWKMIKSVDKGKGVVCTATWLLPVALVPRAWDFSDPPPPHKEVEAVGQSTPASPSAQRFSSTLTTPKPSTDVPNGVPRSSSAYSSETRDEELRPVISSQPPVLPELVVSSPGSIDGAPPGSADGETHHTYEKVQHNGIATAH